MQLPSYRRDEESQPPVHWPDYVSNPGRAPKRPLVLIPQRLTEITGPLLGSERVGKHDNDLTMQHAGEPLGQRIIVTGRVLDGAGDPVPDALIETWQADPDGRFDHPDDPRGAVSSGFRGFGRSPTDVNGRFEFLTRKPGALPGQAPHIDVSVFCRGMMRRLITRIYFPDDVLDDDPVLALVAADLRHTLVASFDV